MDRSPKYLAVNIKYYREKMGVSQAELAARLNVRQPSVANYEAGKTKPETEKLLELATIFGVTVDQLCTPIKSKV
ncbi:MAG: helix-turn-helix transcriptional regulator [Ruminococcus sp.]|nr:helix-turn-helix transcriptional regulator [Ruminococcus sp.]